MMDQTNNPHITPPQVLEKGSEIKASLDVNEDGWYGLNLGDRQWLTPTEAKGLLEYLMNHLPVLCNLEGNNITKEQELARQNAAHPEEEGFIKVEWHIDHWGGSYYGSSSQTAYIPVKDVGKYGFNRAFEHTTEEDSAHIISSQEEAVTRAEIDEDAALDDAESVEEGYGNNKVN
jgi:hypothetical protein